MINLNKKLTDNLQVGDFVNNGNGKIGIYVGQTKSGSVWIAWDHKKFKIQSKNIKRFQ